jgi:hypothetical protein
MMLPKKGAFHFAGARWADVMAKKPVLGQIFAASATGSPGDAYAELMEENPDILACLLNITTAMQQVSLPQNSPLDYFKTLDLAALAPDRIFAYADAKLVDHVRQAAQQGEFDTQPAIDLTLHPGATSSFKQNQFGELTCRLHFMRTSAGRSPESIAYTSSLISTTSKTRAPISSLKLFPTG